MRKQEWLDMATMAEIEMREEQRHAQDMETRAQHPLYKNRDTPFWLRLCRANVEYCARRATICREAAEEAEE